MAARWHLRPVNWCHFDFWPRGPRCDTALNFKCQRAPGAAGVFAGAQALAIVRVGGCVGNKKALIIMCYLAQSRELYEVYNDI